MLIMHTSIIGVVDEQAQMVHYRIAKIKLISFVCKKAMDQKLSNLQKNWVTNTITEGL